MLVGLPALIVPLTVSANPAMSPRISNNPPPLDLRSFVFPVLSELNSISSTVNVFVSARKESF